MAYLDHAATTPMLPEAIDAVRARMGETGNPSSLHGSGRAARRQVEEAREALAEAVHARPSEVIFTTGGTESDNLAVKGIYWARRAADARRVRVLASAIEHHAVLDAVEWLGKHEGAEITWLPVDRQGRVDVDAARDALAADPSTVALMSVMWANNEVGTVQPMAELSALAAEYEVPLHTDAVQATAWLPIDFTASGAAALALTGHKLGGPCGAGALLLGRDVACEPLLHGGGQERDVRSGTIDVAGVVGLATALTTTLARRGADVPRVQALRDRLEAGVRDRVDDVVVNGDPENRLPGISHLSFPGCEGDALLMLLDARGVECSTGSACSAGVAQPSHVLLAMGAPTPVARGSLRFSLGVSSTDADVDAVLEAIGPVVARARKAGLS